MSNKKTRKEKSAAQQSANARKAEIKKLEELKEQLKKKLDEQRKEKFKQFNIRNLKFFGNTCNFLAPFVLSAGIAVGVFRLCGGGFPFHTDEIKKYRLYNLDFDTKGYVTMDDEYRTYGILDELKSNSLVVYSPWDEQNGQYIRFKREYNIGTLNSLDLYDAVLNEDYSYIEENVTDFKEEIQTTNRINEEESNDYIIQASLHMLDMEDTLVFSETDLKNIIITIIEVVLGLGVGSIIAWKRDFDYLWEIECINDEYKCTIKKLNSTKEKLEDTNQKILSLSKTKGGRK